MRFVVLVSWLITLLARCRELAARGQNQQLTLSSPLGYSLSLSQDTSREFVALKLSLPLQSWMARHICRRASFGRRCLKYRIGLRFAKLKCIHQQSRIRTVLFWQLLSRSLRPVTCPVPTLSSTPLYTRSRRVLEYFAGQQGLQRQDCSLQFDMRAAGTAFAQGVSEIKANAGRPALRTGVSGCCTAFLKQSAWE